MTLMNKLLRVFPKKKIDIAELECKKTAPRNIKTITVPKTAPVSNPSVSQGMTKDCEYEILEMEIMPEKIICPDCGGMTLEGLEFCDKCGGDLTNN